MPFLPAGDCARQGYYGIRVAGTGVSHPWSLGLSIPTARCTMPCCLWEPQMQLCTWCWVLWELISPTCCCCEGLCAIHKGWRLQLLALNEFSGAGRSPD